MTQVRLLPFAVVLAAALLAACSDPAAPPPPAPTASPVAAAPAPSVAAQPNGAAASPTERILIVFLDADIEVGPAPLRVQFSTYDPYQSMMKPEYRWDFGDGSPISTQRAPVHVYEKPGNYEAKLFVEDGGMTDEDSVEIQVQQPEAE